MDSLSIILPFLAGLLSEFLGLSKLETACAPVFRVVFHMGSCCEETQASLWSEHVPSGVEGRSLCGHVLAAFCFLVQNRGHGNDLVNGFFKESRPAGLVWFSCQL